MSEVPLYRMGVHSIPSLLGPCGLDFIRTSTCDEYPGFMKITAHLDHISHCKTAFGTNWSNT